MKYLIALAIVVAILGLAIHTFLYRMAKQHDKASRSGVDPRHDDVDEEALRKIRGDK